MSEDDDEGRLDAWGPDESDRNDEEAEVPCPYCKREIPEEAQRCPYCGCYLTVEDAPRQPKPWWWVAAVILLVLLLLGFVLRWG